MHVARESQPFSAEARKLSETGASSAVGGGSAGCGDDFGLLAGSTAQDGVPSLYPLSLAPCGPMLARMPMLTQTMGSFGFGAMVGRVRWAVETAEMHQLGDGRALYVMLMTTTATRGSKRKSG